MTLGKSIDLMIGMLLVSRSAHVEENALEVFHQDGVHLSSFLKENFKSSQAKL